MNPASHPEVFELSDGNFAFIGADATSELESHLPADASRADYERIVIVDRATLISARDTIPEA
ncbi:hypothetical protein [Streptomyces sp. NPDC052012]|uniref:hypothetical protein n=1 Tax=Streptomyces sp. NPDC052012 TaxID=3155051 RepID=UPI003450600E